MAAGTMLLSVAEAATRLGLLQVSVRDAVHRGYLQPNQVVDGVPWFTPAVVDHFAQELGLRRVVPAPLVARH